MANFTNSIAQHSEVVLKSEHHAKLSPEELAKKKTDHMTKSLALDKSQEKAIYDLNLEHAKKQEALRTERRALKKKVEFEKTNHKTNISDILTDEQKAKMEEIRAERIEKRKHSQHSRPPKPPKPSRIED